MSDYIVVGAWRYELDGEFEHEFDSLDDALTFAESVIEDGGDAEVFDANGCNYGFV